MSIPVRRLVAVNKILINLWAKENNCHLPAERAEALKTKKENSLAKSSSLHLSQPFRKAKQCPFRFFKSGSVYISFLPVPHSFSSACKLKLNFIKEPEAKGGELSPHKSSLSGVFQRVSFFTTSIKFSIYLDIGKKKIRLKF